MLPTPSSQNNTFSKDAFWVETNIGQIFVWLYLPSKTNAKGACVVLCPPLGHEYTHSHRSYRHIAEVLATSGITVIRFDYYGTGDSDGTMFDQGLIVKWKDNIEHLVQMARSIGHIETVGTFGVRLGATLALDITTHKHSDFCLVWNPIIKGRRYTRELNAVSRMSVDEEAKDCGFYEAGGFPITNELEQSIQTINLLDTLDCSESDILYFKNEKTGSAEEDFINKLSQAKNVTFKSVNGYEEMMYEPHHTIVPVNLLVELEKWSNAQTDSQEYSEDVQYHLGEKNWQGNGYKEAIFNNDTGLFAITCGPINDESSNIVVFLNSGSVHHVGPNRLYVELSRRLSQKGIETIRVDLKNLGDSTLRGAKYENDTYPPTACEEIADFLGEVKSRYPAKKLHLCGVCSGSYHALHSALGPASELFDNTVLINPLTFAWKEGMSLEMPTLYEVNKGVKHYENSLRNLSSWKKLVTGKVAYSYLFKFAMKFLLTKIKGLVNEIASAFNLIEKNDLEKKLLSIVDKNININFIFSSTDPGYGLLKDEGGLTVKKLIKDNKIKITHIMGADHTFSKSFHREKLLQSIEKYLN